MADEQQADESRSQDNDQTDEQQADEEDSNHDSQDNDQTDDEEAEDVGASEPAKQTIVKLEDKVLNVNISQLPGKDSKPYHMEVPYDGTTTAADVLQYVQEHIVDPVKWVPGCELTFVDNRDGYVTVSPAVVLSTTYEMEDVNAVYIFHLAVPVKQNQNKRLLEPTVTEAKSATTVTEANSATLEAAIVHIAGICAVGEWEAAKYVNLTEQGKFYVKWREWAAHAIRAREDETRQKKEMLVKKMKRCKQAQGDLFWGPNWVGATTSLRNYKRNMENKLKHLTPIGFLDQGEAEVTDVFPGTIKFMPHMLQDASGSVVKVVKEAYETRCKRKQLKNWSDEVKQEGYMQKLLYKVTVAALKSKISRDFPDAQYEGKNEIAPPAIQKLFDQVLANAAECYNVSVEDFVNVNMGGVIYDFTLNYFKGHTMEHSDEPDNHGPGAWVGNVYVQGEGMLHFGDNDRIPRRAGKPHRHMSGVWQKPGDCVAFSGEARVIMAHGVLMDIPAVVTTLPLSEQELDKDPEWFETVRIVATVRGGELTQAQVDEWKEVWDDPHTTSATLPTPDSSEPVSASTADIKLSAIIIDSDVLPKPGTLLPKKPKSPWDACLVTDVQRNFVVTDGLPRSGLALKQSRLCLMPGAVIEIRRHPGKDDRITTFKVWAVGIVMAGGQHEYRAAVLQRKVGPTAEFGGPEMWAANCLSLLPSMYNVRSQKFSLFLQLPPCSCLRAYIVFV